MHSYYLNLKKNLVLSTATCWTLTNIIHSILMYFFMHTVKGPPFHTTDQGNARFLTAWEQIDGEVQVCDAYINLILME